MEYGINYLENLKETQSSQITTRSIYPVILFLIAAIFFGNPQRASAIGDHFDNSFGGNGKVTTDFGGLHDDGNDVAIQADGKIVVVGNSTSGFLISRYNTNGTLDTTFNGTGKVIDPINGLRLYAVAIQTDGKIVIGGDALNSVTLRTSMFLTRFNTNGTYDTSFGTQGNGRVVITFGSGDSFIRDLALQPDGKIVAVGGVISQAPTTRDWVTARFNANGTLDTSFGDGGSIFTDFGGDTDEVAQAVSVLSNGRILIAGIGKPGNNTDFALAQYTANGSPVISFGTGGKVTTHFQDNDGINDVKVQPDGKIVAAGYGGIINRAGKNFALARYNSNGTLDTSFDEDGKVTTNLNFFGDDSVNDIALQSDGKIIAVGDNNNVDFSIVRYNSNGSLHTSFGQAGILFTDINGSADTANAVALQTDGKIVVAGTSLAQTTGSTRDFAVVRYLPNSAKTPFDFDGDSKTDVSIYRPSLGEWWYLRSSNGTNYAAQFGSSTDKPVPADFTGDGKTDIAFFRPSVGEWFVLRSEDSTFYSFPFGSNGDIPAPADFDGDSKADAALFRPSSATWFIFRSSDNGVTIQNFGISQDRPVIADYDGDGKADIAIFRPSNSQWWINRSQAGLIAYQFGASGDKAVQGDYTGDGKADVAFFRPSSGQWFILRSEDSSFFAFPFGQSGDTPVAGDYDGDGRMDAAVFRPGNNVWYISGTTSGVQTVPFGVTGDVPLPSVFGF